VIAKTKKKALGFPILEGMVPVHSFASKNFTKLTYCAVCKQLLWGLKNQGKECSGCGATVHHKKCEALLAGASCTGRAATSASILEVSDSDLSSSSGSVSSSHDFVLFTFTQPTFCVACRQLLWGLRNQGFKVCVFFVFFFLVVKLCW